ncbi:MAG: hypothetical protein LQ343_000065 [Gyalolechia ehrenbergii]|nr:MAG: hypothetical protein LQ343_000065 [Gyalolechia ehrenbergii]
MGPSRRLIRKVSEKYRYVCRSQRERSTKLWKDLPSENWAEMMDFWHCHKPDTDDTIYHYQDGLSKGYGAASTIESIAGVGLLDPMYLLLSHDDVNVVTGQKAAAKLWAGSSQYAVHCASCKHPVGNTAGAGCGKIKLYKWEIRLAPTESSAWQKHPADKFVSAEILAMIESQGVQRFVVHDGGHAEDNTSILVWIFNTSIIYSSTLVPESPRRAMKVYYKTIAHPTKVLEQEGFKADELQLPDGALRSLQSALDVSNRLLPVSSQRFQDWSVGLLAH